VGAASGGAAPGGAVEIECQAHQEDSRRPVASYPTSLLTTMETGNSLYPPYVLHHGTEAAICRDNSSGDL
jgi:hypothetical protein